jgi:threonine aldolase
VFGDDPTTIKLEALGASMFGREAALFVPTGTMANLICCLLHCSERGSELIVGAEAHIHVYEQGGIAQFGGVHSRTVPNETDGTMSLAAIEAAVRPNDVHFPVTRLVCLETTQNRCVVSTKHAS